jgi:hypothetical protein
MIKKVIITTLSFGIMFFAFHFLVLYVSNGKVFRKEDAIESAYLSFVSSVFWFFSFYVLERIRRGKKKNY